MAMMEVKVTGLEPFKSLVEYVAELVGDERMSLEIRNEIMNKLEEIMEGK